jgi:hypothetical protein
MAFMITKVFGGGFSPSEVPKCSCTKGCGGQGADYNAGYDAGLSQNTNLFQEVML